MTTLQRGLLMVLPFALWGTAMAAMAPLVESGGAGPDDGEGAFRTGCDLESRIRPPK